MVGKNWRIFLYKTVGTIKQEHVSIKVHLSYYVYENIVVSQTH